MRAKASAANERLRQQQAKHFQQDVDIFPASRPTTTTAAACKTITRVDQKVIRQRCFVTLCSSI